MNKIVMVDDDLVLTEHYAIALRLQGFDVQVFSSVEDLLIADIGDCALLICDLMMPSGKTFSLDETQNGLITGLLLIELLRSKGLSMPCALLTNLNIAPIFAEVERRMKNIGAAVLMKKSEFNPIEFARIVDLVVNGEMKRKLSPALHQRLTDSLLLKPAFFGVGVDLKRLFGIKD